MPRIGVHSFSDFVHEVAEASTIKQMITSISGLLRGRASRAKEVLLRRTQPAKLERLFPPGQLLWVLR